MKNDLAVHVFDYMWAQNRAAADGYAAGSKQLDKMMEQRADLLAALTKIKAHSRDAAIRQIAANAIAKAES